MGWFVAEELQLRSGRGCDGAPAAPTVKDTDKATDTDTRDKSNTDNTGSSGNARQFFTAMLFTLSPRKRNQKPFRKSPRTPLDHSDSFDHRDDTTTTNSMNKCSSGGFDFVSEFKHVTTPRPGRAVCEFCGCECAGARMHCVRGTSDDDASNDYHVSLCDKCTQKEDAGTLRWEIKTARRSRKSAKNKSKESKMNEKMKKLWSQIIQVFLNDNQDHEEDEKNTSPPSVLRDGKSLNSTSFKTWIYKSSDGKVNNAEADAVDSDSDDRLQARAAPAPEDSHTF
eukprot:CAMPEP_0198234196 /NCGR_PEP_ID=MMETSP1446-20131203/270_1 /TAXON_ID=1461542 ORGANISM="Unidentified sp, Strain CCMP2111" /NCGR_SAMPLE_ID=MMETSP1446 /ASSEMBLY_ACC=CAM_ASM_001112 /LENGTH=281 /DNA_ID=CAMNT_0043914937 /DNA_START=39 /DNA_END=885 /DNA_ORIENTATION=+